jgi:hypothetical protein
VEASGTPTPPGRPDQPSQPAQTTTPPPPPPPATPADEEKASGGWRALGILLALALAFAAAVMIVAMIDIGDTPTCDDRAGVAEEIAEEGPDAECFEGSSGQKTASLVLGWPSGVVAAFGALFALYFAATGRGGRTLLTIVGVAVALGALSIGIGSI